MPFVGRRHELELLVSELSRHRLVTLAGLGGSGKTRLAVQLARLAAPAFPEGITFVDLSSAMSVAEADDAVAAALRLNGSPGAASDGRGVGMAPESLLLLDNVQQIPDVRFFISGLLDAGSAHLLLTSRVPIGLPGEVVRAVAPLAEADAVRPFVERAQEAVPDLVPDPAEVAKLVRLLDGVPLAIELAAARLRVVDLRTLTAIISEQLNVLPDTAEGRPLRHRTVTAVLADAADGEVNTPRPCSAMR